MTLMIANANPTGRKNSLQHVSHFRLAREVFRGKSPVGKSIQVGNQHFFRIVGVQAYKTPSAGVGSSLAAQDLNVDVVIPLTTDRSRIGDVIELRRARQLYATKA